MFKEYDVVAANKKLSESVPIGVSGTVSMCYSDNDYEVEFMDDNGETLDVLTVPGDSLTLLIPFKKT